MQSVHCYAAYILPLHASSSPGKVILMFVRHRFSVETHFTILFRNSNRQLRMDKTTEVVITNTRERKKSYLGKTFKHKKSIFLRCVLILISLLTFLVVVTFYNQLRQASQLLFEIKQRSLALNTNDTLQWRKNTRPETIRTNSEIEFDDNIFDRILNFAKAQNDSEFSEDDLGQAIRRRFQENVYMIRKRFYESHQSTRLKTNTVQKATQDVQTTTKGVQENLRDLQGNTQYSAMNLAKLQEKNPRVKGARTLEARVENTKAPKQMTTNLIIIAYHRSGSSFLGEMFNRDPEAFYLFEPIHTIDAFLDARRRFPVLYDTLIRNLLDTIFKCDFSKNPFFVNTLTSSPFRLKSQALTSHGLCDPRVNSGKMHLCQRINDTVLTKLCSSRPLRVIKTIRMARWKNLDFLVDSSHTSFKAIHLVRDPRGIIASRVSWLLERISRDENSTSPEKMAVRFAVQRYVRILSENLCKQMANDINDWTKRVKLGRAYAMVRYEDASKQPLTIYKQISKFAGVAQAASVIGWLESNTKSSDLNYYSTTRNSSAVPHMWRRSLTLRLVNEIQKNCAQVMGILGYKMVHSEWQLRNMKEPLVVDWGDNGFLRTKPYANIVRQ